jgi:SsrA-binding protein
VAKPTESPGEQLIVRNRRAGFDYELGERFEAGLVLIGSEVKVLRMGKADLSDSWCSIQGGEAFLQGVNIPVLTGAAFGHEAKRARKLLLHEREIETIKRGIEREGMTVAATRLYFKGGRVKVELALAKGKKKEDKRETVKAREADREARAAMARGRRRE